MNWHEFFQLSFFKPMLWIGGAALPLFVIAWWRDREAGSALPLALLGLVWAVCHVKVYTLSYLLPPKEAVDWLVPGAEVLTLLGLVAWWLRERKIPVAFLSALIIAAAAWLALRQLPWLLHRGEAPAQRLIWTVAGCVGVLAAFLSAEWTASRVSPAAVLGGLAIFSLLAGLGLWSMASPERMIARPLAVTAMGAGAAVAALLRSRTAVLTPGMAGWIGGGILILFYCGCLSRVTSVPVWPMAAAVAGIPAATLLVALHRRLFFSGTGMAWLAGLLLSGAAVYWLCAADQQRQTGPQVSPASTAADDTGAYD